MRFGKFLFFGPALGVILGAQTSIPNGAPASYEFDGRVRE